jgi:hypothetical protein
MSYIEDNELFLYKNILTDYCNSAAIINYECDNNKIVNMSTISRCKYNRGIVITKDERLSILKWATSIMLNLTKLQFRRAEYILNKNDPEIPAIIFEIKKRIEKRKRKEGGVKNTNALSTAEDQKDSLKNNIANMEEKTNKSY